jgi:hypothetical protein
MAGKKQVKKAGAKKKAAKKAPAKKAAKKAAAKKALRKAPARKAPAKTERPARSMTKATPTEQEKRTPAEALGKEWERSWARIVAKTWTDPDFKAKLLHEPKCVLEAEGLPLLHDVDIRIVVGEGRFTMEIPLPDRPIDLEGEIIEDLIGQVGQEGLKPKKCVMSSCCC